MAKLTMAQIKFLERHKIPISWTFDATGLSRSSYREIMKTDEKFIAFGVFRCLNGHTLRNRSGDCIQCRTSAIAFGLRSSKSGSVYIARSQSIRLIKIGMSNDPFNRIYIANLEGYAEASDWRVKLHVFAENCGEIEISMRRALAENFKPKPWIRNGEETVSKETFNCSYAVAKSMLLSQLNQAQLEGVVEV